MTIQGFVIKNPNGNILASFPDRGLAAIFCHGQGFPVTWIKPAEIEIRILEIGNVGAEYIQPSRS